MGDSRTTVRYVDIRLVRVNVKKLRKLSRVKIEQYASAYDCGDEFPPIKADDCSGFYTIRDGRHRFQAQLLIGASVIAIEL